MLLLTAFIVLLSASIVYSKNVVYALVQLVIAFFLSGVLLIWQGMEFLGYVLIIVYVGAIAILFLFVVMTLDVVQESRPSLPSDLSDYAPHAAGALFGVFSVWAVHGTASLISEQQDALSSLGWQGLVHYPPHTSPESLTLLLYTSGCCFLFAAGLLLLVAMIGAVLLVKRGDK